MTKYSYLNFLNRRIFDTFTPILQHLLHLGQKCVTIETKNLKHDMIRYYRLMLHTSVCKNLKVYDILHSYNYS